MLEALLDRTDVIIFDRNKSSSGGVEGGFMLSFRSARAVEIDFEPARRVLRRGGHAVVSRWAESPQWEVFISALREHAWKDVGGGRPGVFDIGTAGQLEYWMWSATCGVCFAQFGLVLQ